MEICSSKKSKLNLFALISVASGLYVGYQEGKGVDMSETKEYLLKYGPTAFATVFPLAIFGRVNSASKRNLRNLARGLETGNLNVTLKSGEKKKYMDLTTFEKQDISPKLQGMKETLEKRLANTHYLEPALTSGATTAIQTTWGYITGRFFSQIV